jgi:GntR family transcriptional regulator
MGQSTRTKTLIGTVTEQVALQLKGAFLDGRYRDGERLPAVSDLAQQFGVSPSSVREALKQLEGIGLVEIVHGRGVFARSTKMHWQAKFNSFSETVRQWGKVPGAQLLEAQTLPATAEVAVQLGLSQDAPVHCLKRLRTADQDPIAIETSYLSAERFPDLLETYRDPRSLYQLLHMDYGVRLVAGLQTLEAVAASPEEAKTLAIPEGAPALLVATIAYDVESFPVEYGLSLFRGDRYRYVVRLLR